MKYTEPGEHTLVYKAEDECGNTTEQIRSVVVEAGDNNIIVDEDLSGVIPWSQGVQPGLPLTQLQNVSAGDKLTITLKAPVVFTSVTGEYPVVNGDLIGIDGGYADNGYFEWFDTNPDYSSDYLTPTWELDGINDNMSIYITDEGGELSSFTGVRASHITITKTEAGE